MPIDDRRLAVDSGMRTGYGIIELWADNELELDHEELTRAALATEVTTVVAALDVSMPRLSTGGGSTRERSRSDRSLVGSLLGPTRRRLQAGRFRDAWHASVQLESARAAAALGLAVASGSGAAAACGGAAMSMPSQALMPRPKGKAKPKAVCRNCRRVMEAAFADAVTVLEAASDDDAADMSDN
jgi:hypothetical protein